jgi:hypothetical protein
MSKNEAKGIRIFIPEKLSIIVAVILFPILVLAIVPQEKMLDYFKILELMSRIIISSSI